MKNFFKLSAIALTLSIAIISCSKDEDETPSVDAGAAIVGIYDVNNTTAAFYLNGIFVQADTTNYVANELVVQFTADGKLISTEVDSTEPSGYLIDTTFYTATANQITNIDKSSTPFDTTIFAYTLTGSALRLSLDQTDTTSQGVVRISAAYNATKR